jgi:hypothetical protein
MRWLFFVSIALVGAVSLTATAAEAMTVAVEPQSAAASETAVSAPPDGATEPQNPRFQSHADFSFGAIGEDLFLMLHAEQSFAHKGFLLQLSAPLRFRVRDNAPSDSPGLREQDWDQASDWARIVRMLSFQHQRDDLRISLELGELNGVSMGHGALIGQYFNSTDMDYYQGGLDVDVQISHLGVSFFMSNVVEPALFAGRLETAPLAWFLDAPMAQRFALGMTLFGDRGVPHRALETGRTALVVVGFDAAFRFVDLPRAFTSVYVDWGVMDGSGGVHLGLAGTFLLSENRDIRLSAQAEYRYAGEDYYPAFVNPFYDYNRHWFSVDEGTGMHNTFAEHLANPRMDTKNAHGLMLESRMNFGTKTNFLIRYDYLNRHRPHWLLLQLSITPTPRWFVNGFYAGQDIAGGAGIFSGEALMGLAIGQQFLGPLRWFAEWQRRFRSIATGMPAHRNEFSSGVGVVFSY